MNAVTAKLVQILENRKQKSSQSGFTLLELLVVVAILAAIAGTATIALKDTDMRASAAAHVAMMDELNKGIRTYRVLRKNELPSRFDSLLQTASGGTGIAATKVPTLGFDPTTGVGNATGDAFIGVIPQGVQEIMVAGGITQLMYVDPGLTDVEGEVTGEEDCANLAALVKSRKNAVVAGNIFMSPAANGCGKAVDMFDPEATPAMTYAALKGVYWNGGSERLTGMPDIDAAGKELKWDEGGSNVYLLTGIGPSSSLFDTNTLGGLTTVPVYRHVKAHEYNRFVAAWNVGKVKTGTAAGSGLTATNITPGDQCELVAILDGALDTKEEELGEWDGTRNTI